MRDVIIVSRHDATVRLLRKRFPRLGEVPVYTHVSTDTIDGKIVIGNLPLHLAARANVVYNVSIDVPPDLRGKELSEEDLERCNVRLEPYCVLQARDVLGIL